MFLSNPAKSFLAGLLLLLSTVGCGLLRSDPNTATPQIEEPKNRIPFKTNEPENFQCEIVETAGETVRRKRLAKKGNWRRVDFDVGEKSQRALLQIDKEYILDIGRSVFAETTSGGTAGQFDDLTHELLNTGGHADFEEAGREGTMVRYIVRPVGSDSTETVVHYDESTALVVKQEFFSIASGERTLQFTVEITNFKSEPDADGFSIPAGFRKISIEEMLRTINK